MVLPVMPLGSAGGGLAAAIGLSVANIDDPSAELGAIAGTVKGEFRLCYQTVAGVDQFTLYSWDDASSDPASAPYRINGTSGQWVAESGKYHNGTAAINAGFSSTTLTASALTSGRVPYATTGGLLTDSANLRFDGTSSFGINGLSGSAALTVGTASGVTGTAQRAVYINGYAINSSATAAGYGIMINSMTTENAVFTMALMRGVDVSAMTKGGLATVTAADAYHSAVQTVGATSNTGFHYGNGTVASGTWGFYSSAGDNNYLGTGILYHFSTTDVSNRIAGSSTLSARYQQNHTAGSSVALNRFAASSLGGFLVFGKSRGATVGSYTVVNSGDSLGEMSWNGSDGTDMANAASMRVTVDGTPGSGDMPGKWWVATSADGAEAPTDRFSIDAAGQVAVLATTDATSTTTGSLTTLGGISYGTTKSLYGGAAVLSGLLTAANVTISAAGVLKLGNTAAVGVGLVSTHSITVQDSTGTTYRIPVLV